MQNTLACEYQEMSSFSPLVCWFSNTDADHFKLIEIDSFFVRRVIFLTEIILNLLPWKLVKQLEHLTPNRSHNWKVEGFLRQFVDF